VAKRGTLFLFDEPTTGLHFDDIAKLMRALRKLLDAGHSLLVIEHNLDVIRAADWIVDLGPRRRRRRRPVVCTGTPDDVKAHATSHTGPALREYEAGAGLRHAACRRRPPLQSVLVRARAGAPGGRRTPSASSTPASTT
jgi:excinuclease ABC subunit A